MQNRNDKISNLPLHLLTKGAFLSMLVLTAAGPISCAVVNDDTSSIAATSPKQAVVATKVAHVNKVYGYSAAAKPDAQAIKVRATAYFGTGPYICSPSGFGQKSRCFVRQSI
jgi:hypothetical protein